MVTGLEMYPLYVKLEKIVVEIESQRANSTVAISETNVKNIKISGTMLLKIFDDSYEKMSTSEYNPEKSFPQMFEGRNFK